MPDPKTPTWPTDADIDKQHRRAELLGMRGRGEPWLGATLPEAVALELVTAQQADEFVAIDASVRFRGYKLLYGGGVDCRGVHIGHLPRTEDGGYELPDLLKGVTYQGEGMQFVDVGAPTERQHVVWIGRHRHTGKLIARTEIPADRSDFEEVWLA